MFYPTSISLINTVAIRNINKINVDMLKKIPMYFIHFDCSNLKDIGANGHVTNRSISRYFLIINLHSIPVRFTEEMDRLILRLSLRVTVYMINPQRHKRRNRSSGLSEKAAPSYIGTAVCFCVS